jgi:hypothetical protein
MFKSAPCCRMRGLVALSKAQASLSWYSSLKARAGVAPRVGRHRRPTSPALVTLRPVQAAEIMKKKQRERPARAPVSDVLLLVASTPQTTAEQIVELIQLPSDLPDWGRNQLIAAVRDLIWEAEARTRALSVAPTPDDVRAALTKVLETRVALQRLNGLVDVSPIDALVAELSILLGTNPAPCTGGGRGRRKGSDGDWLFKWLVRELLDIARWSGAAGLTLSKGGGKPCGTLVEALNLLRPHVGCIPVELPYKTLERLHAERARPRGSGLATLKRLFPPR